MIFIIAKIYEGLRLMDSIEIEKFAVCLCFGKNWKLYNQRLLCVSLKIQNWCKARAIKKSVRKIKSKPFHNLHFQHKKRRPL